MDDQVHDEVNSAPNEPLSQKIAQQDRVRHIGWDELDKRKFFIFGPSISIGVRLLIFPPTLIKTRLQVQKQSSLYSGTYDAFKKTLKHEGIRGLYKGFATSLLTLISGQVYVTTLEVVRSKLTSFNEASRNLLAGICASFVGQTITVPVDIISQKQMMMGQRVQTGASSKNASVTKNAWNVAVGIYKTVGLRGFYTGYLASLMTYTPSSGIWWSSYYMFNRFYGKFRPDGVPDLVVQGLSGPSASVVASVCTNPIDVIRTRLQLEENGKSNIRSIARVLYQEEGFRALHKGLTARLMSSIPTGFVLIVSYEIIKKLSVKNEYR